MFIFQKLANVSWSYLVRTGDVEKSCRKRISFGNEHAYVKPCASVEEQGESFHIQAKNLVKNIDNCAELTTIDSQLNSVANRHSILCPSGSHCTTDTLLLSTAVLVGHAHLSLDHKISGIQRLFSTVALAYGADNRVNIVQVLKMFLNEC